MAISYTGNHRTEQSDRLSLIGSAFSSKPTIRWAPGHNSMDRAGLPAPVNLP